MSFKQYWYLSLIPRNSDLIGVKYCDRQESALPRKYVYILEPVNVLDYMAKGHQAADGIKVPKSADLK